jgi:hypothetical protein
MISLLRSITPVSAGSDYDFTESVPRPMIPSGGHPVNNANLPEHMTRITEMCLAFINERGQEEHDSNIP